MLFEHTLLALAVLGLVVTLKVLLGMCGIGGGNKSKNSNRPLKKSYDFIVVGGGSAGAVVAARLSEDPSVSVLLMEAGGDDDTFAVKTPLLAQKLQRDDQYDWQYKTTSQQHACKAFNDHTSSWPRGRVLGGCSSINYMAYVRGSRDDFDSWAQQHGCAGWSYDDVLPYFKKLETVNSAQVGRDDVYRGYDGPVTCEDLAEPHGAVELFVESAKAVGFKHLHDYNGKEQLGVSAIQTTTHNGERMTTSRAYLKPVAKQRTNLTILTHAHVTRVVFNDQKEAVGVEYVDTSSSSSRNRGRGGAERQVIHASKEVVLSGGAIGSPHILMVSGVGARDELTKAGVQAVVADVPDVGKNLQDHLFVGNGRLLDNLQCVTERTVGTLANVLRYVLCKRGPLTSPGLEGTLFFRTGAREDLPGNMPDAQVHCFAGLGTPKDLENFGMKPSLLPANKEPNGMTMLCIILHPKSVGYVGLKNADPFTHPIIEPNYLHDRADIDTFIAMLRRVDEMYDTPVFKDKYNPRVPGLAEKDSLHGLPECPEYGTDAYYEFIARHMGATLYHPVGTCAMGPANSKTAVVDLELRVRGVKRLRVIDASIMPHLTSGNTNVPCIMIGEKGADLIKKQYGLK